MPRLPDLTHYGPAPRRRGDGEDWAEHMARVTLFYQEGQRIRREKAEALANAARQRAQPAPITEVERERLLEERAERGRQQRAQDLVVSPAMPRAAPTAQAEPMPREPMSFEVRRGEDRRIAEITVHAGDGGWRVVPRRGSDGLIYELNAAPIE